MTLPLLCVKAKNHFRAAFAVLKIPIGLRELRGFVAHLWIRSIALAESLTRSRTIWRKPSDTGDPNTTSISELAI